MFVVIIFGDSYFDVITLHGRNVVKNETCLYDSQDACRLWVSWSAIVEDRKPTEKKYFSDYILHLIKEKYILCVLSPTKSIFTVL